MAVATISSKGWVVIPVDMRKKYDLRPGRQVVFVDYGNMLAVMPMLDDPVDDAIGLLAGDTSLTEVLRVERLADMAVERSTA